MQPIFNLADIAGDFKEQLQTIYQAAPLAICIVEMPALRYVSANQNYCRMLQGQIKSEEIVGRSVLEIITQPNSEALASIYRAHEKNEPTFFDVLKSSSMCKAVSYWTGAALPLYRNNGKTFVIALLAEITDKIIAEEKKDEFIAMAVHELRTPLTSLKALSQITLKNLPKLSTDELKIRLENIDKQSTRLSRLISDLLNTVKVSSGKLDLCAVPVMMPDYVQEFVENFFKINSSHQVEIKIPKSKTAKVLIDPERFEQVLYNLLDNAMRYSDASTNIYVKTHEDEAFVQLEVTDHGAGIHSKNLQKIFERFYQASQTKRSGGLGLGLYVAQEIITKMNGKIWAESKGEGHGSTFFIRLPKY